MGPTLEALHRLQQIEAKILTIQGGLDRKQRAIRLQQRRVTQIQEQIATEELQIRSQQVDIAGAELGVRAREEHIAKLRQQLNTVKTNKEYSAILTQLNVDKADHGKLEESALVRMTRLDDRKEQLDGMRAEHAETAEKVEALRKIHQAAENENADSLRELRAEEKRAEADVPPTALVTFQRVSERTDGEALATVIQPNRRRSEYICGGCNMSITTEQVNALLTRDDLQICNSCGRILIVDESGE